MTTVALAARTTRTRAIGILVAVGALALASQFALPLPGTPVPLTLQPLLVVLAGLVLGPIDAAVAMVLYLGLGAAGLPVFQPIGAPGIARLLGPTGGYLLAWPVAAGVTGWLGANRESFATRSLAAMAGILVMYVGGIAQLSLLSGSVVTAAVIGALPFVAADAVKALVAAGIAGRFRLTR
ncbi:MAG TPA: biotin transporter BioY [Gemmatimonadaceae bacterium]|nr:biotin transporter BioY [Gemmatimonadaceae bacterium]